MSNLSLSRLLNMGADLIFPENIQCLCCGDSIDRSRIHGLCDSCIEKIDWDISNPFRHIMDQFAFDDLFPCCVYGFYPRTVISRFKLSGQRHAAKPLGRLLAERLALENIEADGLVPVPMYRKKEETRGFNQAELMCKYISAESSLPVMNALVKTKPTKSMRLSTGAQRRVMQGDAFEPAPDFINSIEGKRLVLVDDVITTGSTADACARLLKSAGAEKVYVLCFAASSVVSLFDDDIYAIGDMESLNIE